MPIGAAEGILEVENAKFSASEFIATTSVGIGTTSVSAYPLVIFKETEPEIRIQEGDTQSSGARFYSNNSNLYIQTGTDFSSGSSGDIAFQTMGGQSTHMIVKSDGKVGVGTGSPVGKFHVSGAGAVYMAISDTSAGTNAKNWWTSVSGNQLTHYLANDANSASQPYMKINRSGYTVDSITFDYGDVGIGTPEPSTALHITRAFSTDNDTSCMISFENTYSTYYDWQIGPSILSNAAMFKIRGNADGFGNLKDIFNMKGDRIGINTTNPLADIHIKQRQTDYYTQNTGLCIEANGTSSFWKIVASSYSTQSGNLAFGQSTDGTTWSDRGYIDDGSTSNFRMNDFTGQHRCFLRGIQRSHITEKVGLIVSANKNKYTMVSGDIVTGQDAIEISESIPDISISQKAYDKACFGVISDVEDPEKRGDLYGAFGTPFPKEKGDDRVYVNSLGEGAIWVTNINGPLESGDYITTSNVVGYGMKQDSEFLANYTVAKITMDCDFNPPTQHKQQIVKELSNVNYYKNTSNAFISETEYNHLSIEQKEEYTLEIRQELVNVLDEHGQLQWEDHPTETEKAYKIRYLTADGTETDEANAVHIAAFVGCTYHCG